MTYVDKWDWMWEFMTRMIYEVDIWWISAFSFHVKWVTRHVHTETFNSKLTSVKAPWKHEDLWVDGKGICVCVCVFIFFNHLYLELVGERSIFFLFQFPQSKKIIHDPIIVSVAYNQAVWTACHQALNKLGPGSNLGP